MPIQQGFGLQTADGYAEVEFENGLVVRLANDTSLEFTELALVDGRLVTHLNLSQGTALINAKLSHNEELSITASDLNLEVPRSGRFRIETFPTENWVTVSHGKVDVESRAGAPTELAAGHALHETGGDLRSLEVVHSPKDDAFDKWASQRDEVLLAARNETSDYLKTKYYTEGFADLSDFGLWSDIPGYGLSWQPYGMGPSWMPYTSGQWLFMNNTGWNWVSAEPWGWIPYHFGGWVNITGVGWAWVPSGVLTWQPTTATWVTVNNQLGWVAVPPPNLPKSPKQPPAKPIVIRAALQNANGAIAAGGRLPMGQAITARLAPAPTPPVFVARADQFASGVGRPATPPEDSVRRDFLGAPSTGPARTLQGGGSVTTGGPAVIRAPGFPVSPAAFARPNLVFRSVPAPHSMPAPATVHAGLPAGWGGGSNGVGRTGGAAGPANNRAISRGEPTPAIRAAPPATHSAAPAASTSHR